MVGIRMLRQDPVENLFSFICSSNNNISRISQMISKLCSHYGDLVGHVEGIPFYTFPHVDKMMDIEDHLRELGFGYRAKYICQTAQLLHIRGLDWLYSLRDVSYDEAKTALLEFSGGTPIF